MFYYIWMLNEQMSNFEIISAFSYFLPNHSTIIAKYSMLLVLVSYVLSTEYHKLEIRQFEALSLVICHTSCPLIGGHPSSDNLDTRTDFLMGKHAWPRGIMKKKECAATFDNNIDTSFNNIFLVKRVYYCWNINWDNESMMPFIATSLRIMNWRKRARTRAGRRLT